MRVTLNMAVSLDGRVAHGPGRPAELSSPEDWARVHRLRADSDAILVGIGTVLSDDPRLTARTPNPPATPPLRVVLDTQGRTPPDANVLDKAAPSLLVTGPDATVPDGADTVQLPGGPRDLAAVVDALADRGVARMLVEGGPKVASSFLEAGLVDELSIYTAPRILGHGPSLWEALADIEDAIELGQRSTTALGEGTLTTYEVRG